jgi:hypothetical protein
MRRLPDWLDHGLAVRRWRSPPTPTVGFPEHPDEHRPERSILFAVDQELGEGAARVVPELADPLGRFEIGQRSGSGGVGAWEGSGKPTRCPPTLGGVLRPGPRRSAAHIPANRTRPGAQEQRIGAGTLSCHDDLGLRLPVRRPAKEPQPLGEFVELEVGDDADRVLLDLVGRHALSARIALRPASCPRTETERLVECSRDAPRVFRLGRSPAPAVRHGAPRDPPFRGRGGLGRDSKDVRQPRESGN